MSVETWPASLPPPNEIMWGIAANTLGLDSAWTRAGQYVELQGARWELTTTFRSLTDPDQRELQGFLDHLRGSVGVVAMPTWVHDAQQGSAAGTILATGAAHAKVVSLAGVTGAGISFRRGDLIGIASRLYRVTADATHEEGFIEALSIAPPLRLAVADQPVRLSEITCPMRLVSDGQASGRFRPKFADWALTWAESLPPATDELLDPGAPTPPAPIVITSFPLGGT
jgi:hypothetical protein